MSRNISYDESTEFTCLHDIQHREYDEDNDKDENDAEASVSRKLQRVERNAVEPESGIRANPNDVINRNPNPISNTSNTNSQSHILLRPIVNNSNSANNSTSTSANAGGIPVNISTHPDIWAAEVTVRDRMLGNRRRNSTGAFGNTHVYGISSGVLSQSPVRLSSHRNSNSYRWMYLPQMKKSIPQNIRRMLYSIEQPNKGKGLIKEECFSSDGRLICSPYGFGFRLLSFSEDCLELPKALAYQNDSHKLYELKYFKCHSDIVVSTRFSPIQPLLASGCLQGRVVWHQPKF